jgi:hypothetical protein
MKCIKVIKELKTQKIGDISRVSNEDADEKVKSGYFMYAPKSEWKQMTKQKVESTETSKENTKTLKKIKEITKPIKKLKILKKQSKIVDYIRISSYFCIVIGNETSSLRKNKQTKTVV